MLLLADELAHLVQLNDTIVLAELRLGEHRRLLERTEPDHPARKLQLDIVTAMEHSVQALRRLREVLLEVISGLEGQEG